MLMKLDLSSNRLTSLPSEMGQLDLLDMMYISHNRLESLFPEIGCLPLLSVLYLSNNRLTSLPTEIGRLSKLRKLDLSHNQLTCLPPKFGRHLSSLNWSNLSNNQLTSLPSTIGNLPVLEVLDLSTNRLTSLPSELCHIWRLVQLDLSNNQLTSIPSELGYYDRFKMINLSNNQLMVTPIIPPTVQVVLDNQQLPTVLPASTAFVTSSTNLDDATPLLDFALHFQKGDEHSTLWVSAARLATRWPYFHRLLDSGLAEACTMSWDCSNLFSVRVGQCLVSHFNAEPIEVMHLTFDDCCAFMEHAEYLGVIDTTLFQFCQFKLAHVKKTSKCTIL